MSVRGFRTDAVTLLAGAVMISCAGAWAQDRRPLDIPDTTQRDVPKQRQRLILKDGTYQVVLSYKVIGQVVRYQSAERNGETEDIPLELVDLPATERWKREHEPGASEARGSVLSPELAKEEADRAARTPEIAPNLRLPEEDSVLALDTFEGTPELVPLPQQGSDLNKETAHSVQKAAINPSSAPHRIGEVRSEKADVQLHVADASFYVRVGPDDDDGRGGGITVDTHGASSRATPGGGAISSDYVIERVDVRYDSRVIDSFRIAALGTGKKQPDIIELKSDYLPGGHWLRLTPVQPLEFGEYALVEILNDHEVNSNVWDFGVHSDAPENVEAQRPEKRRPATLERRQSQ